MRIFFLLILILTPIKGWACDPIAEVYGKSICRESLENDSLASFESALLKFSFFQKFGEGANEPTDKEKEKLILSGIKQCKDIYHEMKDDFIKYGIETTQEQYYANCDKAFQSDDNPSINMFKHWKYNKVLHDHYGGKVAFQQAGLEPHDAYKKFMRDIETEGELKILDSKYTPPFNNMKSYLNKSFTYAPVEDYFKEYPLLEK